MDNFFNSAIDYNAFKKALKVTSGETVVINILASDESLKNPLNEKSNKKRKSMSSKYEPSPFGKFFGSRNTGPVDMNDFSGWKNKNYRKTEENFDDYEDEDDTSLFSLSNYMKDKSSDTYNEFDQARSDIQKPITQLPNDDPTLQKFSLDGYMHKLEESIMAKDKFSENDDLLEPIVSDNDFVDQNASKQINKFQDENFFGGNADIEKFAFDGYDTGSNFSLDSDDLDKVKERLSRLEKEAKNLNEKPNEGLITGDELKVDDEPNDAFGEILLPQDSDIETATDSKATRGKKLNEVVINTDAKTKATTIQRPILISTDDIDTTTTIVTEKPSSDEQLNKSEVLTKEDFRDMTKEFMSKLSETLGKSNADEEDIDEVAEYKASQDEMQMKINELVESRERTERETAERLKKIEEERQKIDEEYKSKIKEMEESYSKKYEEFKQKMYIEKLDSERKIKDSESKIKLKKNEEINKLSSKQIGAILRKELKSNFNISNLEMEKKLLEYEKKESIKVRKEGESEEKPKPEKKQIKRTPKVVIVKEAPKPETKPVPKPEPKKRQTPKSRNRKRRIDSDIIGGIQF